VSIPSLFDGGTPARGDESCSLTSIGPGSGDSLVLSMENFKHLSYNPESMTVTVGSGWRVGDLTAEIARRYNVSFVHLRELPFFTLQCLD